MCELGSLGPEGRRMKLWELGAVNVKKRAILLLDA